MTRPTSSSSSTSLTKTGSLGPSATSGPPAATDRSETPDASSVLEAAIGSDHDLALFVQHVLGQMHERFLGVSESILAKVDDFGKDIDAMERQLLSISLGSSSDTDTSAKS